MNLHKDLGDVDFGQPELISSLARAYAVVLNTDHAVPEPLPEPKQCRKKSSPATQKKELVQRFRMLFLSGMPETHSKMQQPGAPAKYYKRFHSLTDVEITSHLEGRATFAAPLIGRDGLTREAALDIDQGGEAAVTIGLHIASELGYSAYGLVSPAIAGGHDGGHIRIPLAESAAPVRARMLAEQIQQTIVARCGLPPNVVEVYPTHKGLRLPFGIHTHTGKRGTLLLQDGTRVELDTNEPLIAIADALALLEKLPSNAADRLPLPPAPPASTAPVRSPNALQRANGGSPIQNYNHHTNLLDWLLSIGGRVAASTRGGGRLLHCPCSNHKHHDARPSLELQPARNPRHGAFVLIGHASGCLFATQRGTIIDAFDAYCRWYGLSIREALERLRDIR